MRRGLLVPRLRTTHPPECAATSHEKSRHTTDTGNQRENRHAARHGSTNTPHREPLEDAPTTTDASLSHRHDASRTDNTLTHADQVRRSDRSPRAHHIDHTSLES